MTKKYFKIVMKTKEKTKYGYVERITILFQNNWRGLIDINGEYGSYNGKKYKNWRVSGPGLNSTSNQVYHSKIKAIKDAKRVYMK
jgi:hypothetical protein